MAGRLQPPAFPRGRDGRRRVDRCLEASGARVACASLTPSPGRCRWRTRFQCLFTSVTPPITQ